MTQLTATIWRCNCCCSRMGHGNKLVSTYYCVRLMNRMDHFPLLPSYLNGSHVLLWHVLKQAPHLIFPLNLSSWGDIVSITTGLCQTTFLLCIITQFDWRISFHYELLMLHI